MKESLFDRSLLDNSVLRRAFWVLATAAFGYRIYKGLVKIGEPVPEPEEPQWPKLAFKTESVDGSSADSVGD